MRTFAREPKSVQRRNSNASASRLAYDFSRIPVHHAGDTIQTKLALNEPEDKYEQEADRCADQVMRVNQPSASPDRGIVSNTEASVHPSAGHSSNGEKALEPEDRQFFESRLNHNFADVRVYADREANESALGLQARAYTVGNKISFGPGEYRPGTSAGRHLLAHELSHVIQQRSISRPDSLIIQRQPQTATKQTPPAKQKTLDDEGVDLNDPVTRDKTPQIIDTVLQRNQRLAPFIGDKLKAGFSIAEQGKFKKEQRDTDFDTSFTTFDPKSPAPASSTLGFFDYKKSVIHLRPDAKFGTALHEAVHRLAAPSLYLTWVPAASRVSGDLAAVLVEGVTAFFTDCILKDEGLSNFNDDYREQKKKAETLVKALGPNGFDLIAKFNFQGVGLNEIGNQLGLSDAELKGEDIKKVFKKLNDKL